MAFTNSDPAMVNFFVQFLRRCYRLPDEAFRVACNLFADHADDRARIEQFWLDNLELPRSCLRKSIVNVYSKHSQRKRRNVLPYGTCRVCVHRTAVVQSIYGSIQEYGGFDRPEWLDQLRRVDSGVQSRATSGIGDVSRNLGRVEFTSDKSC